MQSCAIRLQTCVILHFFPSHPDVDLDDDDWFLKTKFYVMHLVNKVTGYENWSDNEYCYCILSACPWVGDCEKLMLHPTTEPYLLVLIENHFQRWLNQRDWLRANPAARTIPTRTKLNKDWDIFVSKHSSQDGGQKRSGGWGKAGLTRYNELVGKYVQAKHKDPANPVEIKDEWVAWEQNFLAKLRAELGLTGGSKQEDDNIKKGSNTAKPTASARNDLPQPVGMDWNF